MNKNAMKQYRIPGKMIIVGEYAVLEGAPALVAAVDRYCYVDIRATNNGYSVKAPTIGLNNFQFDIDSSSGTVCWDTNPGVERAKIILIKSAFEHFFQHIHHPVPPCQITINTDEFYHSDNQKLGLGSSAAVAVGLTAALSSVYGNLHFSQQDIFNHALSIHSRAQQNHGSGIDVAASSHGGILKYQLVSHDLHDSTIEKYPVSSSVLITPVWTGTSASTSELLKKLSSKQDVYPQEYNSIMTQLSEISELAIESYMSGEDSHFFSQIDNFYTGLLSLGEFLGEPILSTEHQQLREIVHSAGGVYKPSGAGKGDIGLAFTNSHAVMAYIKKQIHHSSYQELELSVADAEVGTETDLYPSSQEE